MRCRLSLIGVLLIAGAPGVRADKTQIKIPLGLSTRDLHIKVNDRLVKKQDCILLNLDWVAGPYDRERHNDQEWSGNWLNKAAGTEVTVEIWREDGGEGIYCRPWNIQYKLTDDGMLNKPDTYDKTIPSAHGRIHGDPMVELFLNNPWETAVQVTDIALTVVSDLSTYDSASWFQATGQTYTFANQVIPAGQVISIENQRVAVQPTDWFMISAKFDGQTEVFAQRVKPIPAPGAVVLGVFGLALVGCWKKRTAVHDGDFDRPMED